MTREEAIERIKWYFEEDDGIAAEDVTKEAIVMAIEALSEPKTIIGIDIPYGSDKGLATLFKGKDEKMVLEEVKEIMTVVRCKDCRFNKHPSTDLCPIKKAGIYPDDDDFCSYGERREK